MGYTTISNVVSPPRIRLHGGAVPVKIGWVAAATIAIIKYYEINMVHEAPKYH